MEKKKPTMKELRRMIRRVHKDSKLMHIARKYVANLGSRA